MIPINKTILLIIISSFFSIQFAFADCEEGFVPNCAPNYEGENIQECCTESWIGDGFADCSDQQWGCDLTCYGNDGGDCVAEIINIEIKDVNPTAINASTGVVKVLISTNKRIYSYDIKFDGINILNAYLSHSQTPEDTLQLIITGSSISNDEMQTPIEIGESILTFLIENFDWGANLVCIDPSNSSMSDESNNALSVLWGEECYTVKQG